MKNNDTVLTVDSSRKTLDIARNMFFSLNAKPDSITRTFSRQIRVNLESLDDLNIRVREKLRMHCEEKESAITRITINFSNHRSYEYETWEEFKQTSFLKSDFIESITVKWDFLVDMPQFKWPQRHCLVVKISSGLKMADFISLAFSGRLEDINDINILNNTVVARVDFINTLLGEEVLNVVSDWVDACDRNNSTCSKLLMFMRKHRNATALLIENAMNIFGFITVFFLLSYHINKIQVGMETWSKDFISDVTISVGIAYTCIYLLKKISLKIAQKTYENLSAYGEGFVFEITNGDKNRVKETEKINGKTAGSIILKLSSSFIFDLICSIIISYIVK